VQATISDVARLAGVSKGTVSKFLSGARYVSAASKGRIADAIAELGYAPNRLAQGLSLRRSHTIGLVVANIGNPFYAELIRGAEDVAASLGYTLLLASTDGDPKRESGIAQMMRQRQVDGVVFASVRLADREVTALARDGMRVVLASRHLPDAEVDMVLVDSVRGARIAVEHLISHGHKKIAYIGGPQSIAQFQNRLEGWREALSHAGLPVIPGLCFSLDRMDVASGDYATRRLLLLKEPPTAIFAATDNLAFGVLRACSQLGLRVPEQLALVGFDNVEFGEIALTPLTSVDGSGLIIGQRAMRMLVDRIQNANEPLVKYIPVRIVIQPSLRIRRSCGCQPAAEVS
jgi:DNA-binding LacI/PurR family transcriptional regulator